MENVPAGSQRSLKGFTLVEVMVAALLFAIVMLYGLSFFVYGCKPMVRAQEYTFAMNLGKSEMEYVKAYKYNKITENPHEIHQVNEGIEYVSRTTAYEAIKGNKVGEAFETYKILTTTVSWEALERGHQEVNFSTIVSSPAAMNFF